MVTEARKLNLISELLKVQSDKVIAEVEAVLRKASAPTSATTKLSDKFAGKLSSGTASKLQKHIAKSRNEWELDI